MLPFEFHKHLMAQGGGGFATQLALRKFMMIEFENGFVFGSFPVSGVWLSARGQGMYGSHHY